MSKEFYKILEKKLLISRNIDVRIENMINKDYCLENDLALQKMVQQRFHTIERFEA